MKTIEQILEITGGRLCQGEAKTVFSGVSINSRRVKEGNLFICIIGAKKDGHRFVDRALKKGASAVLVSKNISCPKNVCVAKVKDTTLALSQIARVHRRQFDIPVVAITGSTGKTTTKELVASILGTQYNVLKNNKSFNNKYGVPLTLLRMNNSHNAAVVEVGTNGPGEIAFLADLIKPTVAVFTNVGDSHLQGLKNRAGVYKEKISLLKLLGPSGTVIYNADDAYFKKIKKQPLKQFKKISYGINENADFRAVNIQKNGNSDISFVIAKKKYTISSPARHNIYNALCAVCCGDTFRIKYTNISRTLKGFRHSGPAGRQQMINAGRVRIINDSYNANPLSFESAIEVLNDFDAKGKKIIVCADMLELGSQSNKLHMRIGQKASRSDADAVLSFGNRSRAITQEISKKNPKMASQNFRSRKKLHDLLKRLVLPDDVVLVKGSRSMQMERTVEFLKNTFNKSQ